MMPLTILSIAYPLARVMPDAVGGAEQVLSQLDRALTQRGHHSIVVAADGSRVQGMLVSFPEVTAPFDEAALRLATRRARLAVQCALSDWPVDVVHIHALDYTGLLPPPGLPVLATLHLPRDCYTPDALHPTRPDTWLQCVSLTQYRTMGRVERMLAPIENGVPLPALHPHAKRSFALTMGRICPEKGFHTAIDACRRVGVPLVLGGQVYAYESHERYFADEIEPRLGRGVRFVGPLRGVRKQHFLAAARCVIIASTIDETSSLLAREALAAGTPVVALRRGALVDVIEHGVTGFLVDDDVALSEAIRASVDLDPQVCREHARERFGEGRMIDAYLSVYRILSAVHPQSYASAR